jgi:hypothetical protein
MTALEARGKILRAGPVSNERLALRKYFESFVGRMTGGFSSPNDTSPEKKWNLESHP